MNKKIVIKGDGTKERGKKIIDYFKSLGVNTGGYKADSKSYYVISNNNHLMCETEEDGYPIDYELIDPFNYPKIAVLIDVENQIEVAVNYLKANGGINNNCITNEQVGTNDYILIGCDTKDTFKPNEIIFAYSSDGTELKDFTIIKLSTIINRRNIAILTNNKHEPQPKVLNYFKELGCNTNNLKCKLENSYYYMFDNGISHTFNVKNLHENIITVIPEIVLDKPDYLEIIDATIAKELAVKPGIIEPLIITPEIKAIIKDAFDNSCKYSSFKDFCETYKIK